MSTLPDDRCLESPPGPDVTIAGAHFVYFGGTSYLGIQARPEIATAAADAVHRYGLHAATSRLGYGETPPLRAAEAAAAAFFDTASAWLLPSGWIGPGVLLDRHRGRQDRLYLDADAHFALRDAARQSGRPVIEFAHADPTALEARIDATLRGGERPIVLTDGVFPISGAIAPLDAYAAILARFRDGLVVVDDAHGLGVLGAHGRGSVEHLGLTHDHAVVWTGTASKGLGGYGGILAGSAESIDELRARSHWFEGSTPLPNPVAAATAAALRIAHDEPQLRLTLADNVRALRAALRGLGLAVTDAPTPIIPLVLGSSTAMRKLHEALRRDGILVPYLPRYAGMGPDGALRIAVFATHRTEHRERLVDALRRQL